MIGLEIAGMPLKLGRDTQIDLEIDCDMFSPDHIESGIVSFPFTIPDDDDKQNSKALQYFDKIEKEGVIPGDIEGVSLKAGGNLLYEGVFEIEKHHNGFEGIFKSGSSLMSEMAGKKITDMVNRVAFDVDFTNQISTDSNICWPSIYCKNIDKDYDVEINRYVGSKYEARYTSGYNYWHFIPMFKLYYIIQEVFRGINYQVGGDYLNLEGMRDVIMFNNFLTNTLEFETVIPDLAQKPKFYLPDHLPEISFADLIRSFKNTFALAVTINSESKACHFWSIKNILADTTYIDWTDKVVEDRESFSRESLGYTAKFSWPSDDQVLKEYPESLEHYKKGDPVNTVDDLPVPSSASKDFYRFVKKDNTYYLCVENPKSSASDPITFKWEKLGANIYPYTIGNGEKEIVSDFTPIVKEMVIEGQKSGRIVNNNGKVRIVDFDWRQIRAIAIGSQIRIDDSDVYDSDFHDVTQTHTSPYLDLDLDFISAVDNVKFSYKLIQDYYLPIIDVPGSRHKNELIMDYPNLVAVAHEGQYNRSFSPRIMLYHGLQEKRDSTAKYPYASPDNYNSKGERIGEIALRWDGPDGLIEKFWKEPLEFLNNTRIVRQKVKLEIEDLINFRPTKKIIIRGTTYLVKKISVPLRMNGIGIAEVEMRKV